MVIRWYSVLSSMYLSSSIYLTYWTEFPGARSYAWHILGTHGCLWTDECELWSYKKRSLHILEMRFCNRACHWEGPQLTWGSVPLPPGMAPWEPGPQSVLLSSELRFASVIVDIVRIRIPTASLPRAFCFWILTHKNVFLEDKASCYLGPWLDNVASLWLNFLSPAAVVLNKGDFWHSLECKVETFQGRTALLFL